MRAKVYRLCFVLGKFTGFALYLVSYRLCFEFYHKQIIKPDPEDIVIYFTKTIARKRHKYFRLTSSFQVKINCLRVINTKWHKFLFLIKTIYLSLCGFIMLKAFANNGNNLIYSNLNMLCRILK